MTTISIAAERDRAADGTDLIAVSESAKQQIGAQAASTKAQLMGPAFFESFSLGPPAITGVNRATVHWRGIE